MNEWGTPDWLDAAAYGDVSGWTMNRWRWEFYRRRNDLREYFDAVSHQSQQAMSSFSGWDYKPHEAGFIAFATDDAVLHFGYNGLPNPRIGDQPSEVIRPVCEYYKLHSVTDCHRRPIGDVLKIGLAEDTQSKLVEAMMLSGIDRIPIAFGEGPPLEFDSMREMTISRLEQCRLVMLENGQVALTFEINEPIEPQIERAREVLRDLQTKKHGKRLQKRRHPAKWLGYLRTLDAREAMPEASWQVFTDALFSAGLVERHKDPAGGYCDPPAQAGRDKWEAADALRFNF